MVQAATAGVTPAEFYRLTLGEIFVAIEGYHERERQSLISRINSMMRALPPMFGKKGGDPYKGLGVKTSEAATPGSLRQAAAKWLWSDNG